MKVLLRNLSVCAIAAVLCPSVPVRADTSNNLLLTGTSRPQVILNPHVYVVDWTSGHDPLRFVSTVRNYLSGLSEQGLGNSRWNEAATIPQWEGYYGWGNSGSGNVLDSLETPNNTKLLYGSWTDTAAAMADSASMTTTQWQTGIEASVKRAAAHFGIKNDLNAIIVVITGIRQHRAPGNPFHSAVSTGGTYTTAYINMPYGYNKDANGNVDYHLTTEEVENGETPTLAAKQNFTTYVFVHELVETVTDPRYTQPAYAGWMDSNGLEGEIADKTQFVGVQIDNSKMVVKLQDNSSAFTAGGQEWTIYSVPPMWSNYLASLVPGTVPDHSPLAETYTAEHGHFALTNTFGTLQVSFDNGGWSNWGNPAGHQFAGSPVGVSMVNPARIDVFGVGADDGHLYHSYSNDAAHGYATKSAWEDLGPSPEVTDDGTGFIGDPSVVSYGPGEYDIFIVSPFGNLWQRRFSIEMQFFPTGARWLDSGWVSWGAAPDGIASGPGASGYVAQSDDGMDSAQVRPTYRIFYINQNGKLGYASLVGWNLPSSTVHPAWNTDLLSNDSGSPAAINSFANPVVADHTSPYELDVVVQGTASAGAAGVWRRVFAVDVVLGNPIQDRWENLGFPSTFSASTWIPYYNGTVGAYSGTTGYLNVFLKDYRDGSLWEKRVIGVDATRQTDDWFRVTGLSQAWAAFGMGVVDY